MYKIIMKYLSLFTQFFLFMIVPIAGCSVLGWYIDKKMGTSFWIIILFFIGAIAGFTNIYKLAMKMTNDPKNPKK